MIQKNINRMPLIIAKNKIFKFALLEGYIFKETKNELVIYKGKNGYGAINITSYRIPDNYVFDEIKELKDFAKSISSNINIQNLQFKKNDFFWSEFIMNGRYWRIWTLFRNHYAVFGSYNCMEEDKEKEIDKINLIIQSLEINS
jgi:hypothetical protein